MQKLQGNVSKNYGQLIKISMVNSLNLERKIFYDISEDKGTLFGITDEPKLVILYLRLDIFCDFVDREKSLIFYSEFLRKIDLIMNEFMNVRYIASFRNRRFIIL